jgi:hypothetical protein
LIQEAGVLRTGLCASALRANVIHEIAPFTGQSAGLMHEVRPAAEIVRQIALGRRTRCGGRRAW